MDSMSHFRRELTKPKRDFLKENRRHLRKLEEQFRETHLDDQRAPLRNQKYANVQPKIQTRNANSAPSRRPASAYTPSNATTAHRRPMSAVTTCDEAVQCSEETKILRSQGTQTADEVVQEGRELWPSTPSWEQRSQLRLNLKEGPEPNERLHQATQRTSSSGDKLVRWDLSSETGDQEASAKSRIPEPSKDSFDQNTVVFNEDERMQTLSQLKAAQDKLLADLNRLPVRSNTLRVQNKRREIDAQLDKIEGMIKTFSRPKRSQSYSNLPM